MQHDGARMQTMRQDAAPCFANGRPTWRPQSHELRHLKRMKQAYELPQYLGVTAIAAALLR
jgi:hypothetical protein